MGPRRIAAPTWRARSCSRWGNQRSAQEGPDVREPDPARLRRPGTRAGARPPWGGTPVRFARLRRQRAAIGGVVVARRAGLRAVDRAGGGRAGGGGPSGVGEGRVGGWREQWEVSKGGDAPAVGELARRLGADPPTGPGGAIVHGD